MQQGHPGGSLAWSSDRRQVASVWKSRERRQKVKKEGKKEGARWRVGRDKKRSMSKKALCFRFFPLACLFVLAKFGRSFFVLLLSAPK